VADDGDTSGKTTARSSRLSRHDKLGNGGWIRQLACGECSGGLHNSRGKSCGKERKLQPLAPFIGGERESTAMSLHAGVKMDRPGHDAAMATLFCSDSCAGAVSLKTTQATVPWDRAQST
jgi:hypothetical protein